MPTWMASPMPTPITDAPTSTVWLTGWSVKLGATFGMSVRRVWGYHIENTVVEWDEPNLIAWRHWAGHRWRYELRALARGAQA